MQLLRVGLEVAGLHRAQRAVHNSGGGYPPSLALQLRHNWLILERLVVVAELQRGVTGACSVFFKRDHIDRKADAHSDRLANRALDRKRTCSECGPHSSDMAACCAPTTPTASLPTRPRAVTPPHSSSADDLMDDIEAEIAVHNGGETFPVLPIGPGSAPARQSRLRLRQLKEEEHDEAAAVVQEFADTMASQITDADSWATGEGYIAAIPERIRQLLRPYTTSSNPREPTQQQRRRPPRVTRTQREHRLDEALDDMAATQRATPHDQRAVRRARRRVGRVRASFAQQELRRLFARDEAKCVASLLARASPETAAEEHPDACPIDAATLHAHFTGVNAPRTDFDYDATSGHAFRQTLDSLAPASTAADAFTDDISVDEVEDQLAKAVKTSSPGHDEVGYDVYSRFAAQLVPLLHAVYQFCWQHRRVTGGEGWHGSPNSQEGRPNATRELAADMPPAHNIQDLQWAVGTQTIVLARGKRAPTYGPERVPIL